MAVVVLPSEGRLDVTRRDLGACPAVVRKARQLVQDVGAKVFGVVLNYVDLKSQENYYYYQSYYHREGYESQDQP